MTKKLSLEWFRGNHKPADKEKLEQALRNSTYVLSKLLEVCDGWEQDLLRQSLSAADYDTPSWAYKQAHRNGDLSRIRKLKDLLSFF